MGKGFAKLLGKGDKQGVAIRTEDEEGRPAVKVFFKPAGLGVCESTFGYEIDSQADEAFEKIDGDTIEKLRSGIEKQFGG